jgi:MbtH protein
MSIFDVEDHVFNVVVNHEDQSSIWPADRELPAGWRAAGKTGTRRECLAYIEACWTDMRPLSLRHLQMHATPDQAPVQAQLQTPAGAPGR